MSSLHLVNNDLKFPHFVAAALKQETQPWEMADALLEDVGPPDGGAVAPSSKNTGLYAKIEEAYLEAKRAGAQELDAKALSRYYNTALAWPPETRSPRASYRAHRELASRPDRVKRMEMLRAQSSTNYVTGDQVRLWKQGLTPTKMVPFLDQVEKRVRTALRRQTVWSRLADSDRQAIAKMLRKLSDEILTGEFK